MQSKAKIIAQLETLRSQIETMEQKARFERTTLKGSLSFRILLEEQDALKESLKSLQESPATLAYNTSPLSTRSRKSSSPYMTSPIRIPGTVSPTAWDIIEEDDSFCSEENDEDDRSEENYASCGFVTSKP